MKKYITLAALLLSGNLFAQTPHLNNTSMLLYDPASNKTLTLTPSSPFTANRTFTFPDVDGAILTCPAPMTDGQLLIGKTGTNPVPATLSAGTGITITNGPGKVTISSNVGVGTGGFVQSTPADPAATSSTTDVMMGMGASTQITISSSGRMMITVSGDVDNNTNNKGVQMQIRYGALPGTPAPANGAAAAGTAVGSKVQFLQINNGIRIPFNLNAIPTGLTPGVTYWIDVAIAATPGPGASGTAEIRDISISAIEF